MEVPATMNSQNLDPNLIAMFTEQQGTVGVRGSRTQFVPPTRPVAGEDQQFTFEMPYTGEDYLDLKNTKLYVRGNLTRADGTKLQADEKVKLANNALHSLFDSVIVKIGHNQQEIQMNDYPYKAYLRQLMTAKVNCPNNVGHGFTAESRAKEVSTDEGDREAWTALSRNIEFCGRTLIDCFQAPGYLLPHTPMTVTFKRSRDQFYVTTNDALRQEAYAFNIIKIGLIVPTIKVDPFLSPLLEMQTDNEVPARYPFESIEIRQFTFPIGALSSTFRKVFQGKIPSKMAIAFYHEGSLVGERFRAALQTATLPINRVQVSINGLVVREHVLDLYDRNYLAIYQQWTDWLGVSEVDWPYDEKDFKEGQTFLPFDFMENCSGSKCDEEALLSGSLDIDVQLQAAAPTDIIMVVYALSPNNVQIFKGRTARHVKTIV